MSVGEKLSKLFKLREQKEEASNVVSAIGKEIDQLEAEILESMKEQGLEKLAVAEGSGTFSLKIYPSVKDKEEFVTWCAANDRLDLLIVRANEASFREYFDKHNDYPDGTDGYEKAKLNVRKGKA